MPLSRWRQENRIWCHYYWYCGTIYFCHVVYCVWYCSATIIIDYLEGHTEYQIESYRVSWSQKWAWGSYCLMVNPWQALIVTQNTKNRVVTDSQGWGTSHGSVCGIHSTDRCANHTRRLQTFHPANHNHPATPPHTPHVKHWCGAEWCDFFIISQPY